MGHYIAQYDDPWDPLVERFDVSYGKPGAKHHYYFTKDCGIHRDVIYHEPAVDKIVYKGKVFWQVIVADDTGTMIPYVCRFPFVAGLPEPVGNWIVSKKPKPKPKPGPVLPIPPVGVLPQTPKTPIDPIVGAPGSNQGLGAPFTPGGTLGPRRGLGGLLGAYPGRGGNVFSPTGYRDPPSDGGAIVAYAERLGVSTPGPGSSSGGRPVGTGKHVSSSEGVSGSSKPRDENTGKYSTPDGAMIGGGYGLFSKPDEEDGPNVIRIWDYDPNTKKAGIDPGYPDPTRDPSGLTGMPLVDHANRAIARVQSGAIPGLSSSGIGRYALALVPEGPDSTNHADRDVSAIDNLVTLDPNAPLVNPTETDYDGGRHYPPRGYRNLARSPYMEALYPDADPHSREAPSVNPGVVLPGAGGDPAARERGTVVAHSAGVRVPSIDGATGRVINRAVRS